MKDLNYLKENIKNDIKQASNKQIDVIYEALKTALKKFDRDELRKNIVDFFKLIFATKRQKCLLFLEDITDSEYKLTDVEKELLRKELLDISNIHRTLIENIISLLGAL